MKLAQKDRDARWTVKYSKAKPREDGSVPAVDLAIPAFGYKNHVSIDRGFGLIRNWTTTARRRARRGAARRRSGPDKHGERRLGGYGLPVGEERSNARAARVGVAHPSQEAARPADA